jgi:hypothetical protein
MDNSLLPLMLEAASWYALFQYHHLGLNGERYSVSEVLRVAGNENNQPRGCLRGPVCTDLLT